MHITTRQHLGQTLIEAIVAVAVIMSAVFGSTTLIISSITAGRISQNRVEAANFAREGVEIVRAYRDANWLKFQQNEADGTGYPPLWNAAPLDVPLNGTSSFRASMGFGNTNRFIIQNCGSCPASTNKIYRVTYTGSTAVRNYFSQFISLGNCNLSGRSCVETKYSRVIRLTHLPEDMNGDGDTSDTGDSYLLVESIITWSDQTGTKTLTAQTRLYDWK